jgi:CRISPR-associated endonuclease/helicase Cas3
VLARELPAPPDFLRPEAFPKDAGKAVKVLRHEFWTRMLLSALVDADRLDTERFMDPRKAGVRERVKGRPEFLARLRDRLEAHMAELTGAARRRLEGVAPGARGQAESVLRLRAGVLDACRAAAERPPGRYSLTVPTGGGKTLAALAFALGHAVRHGLRRVIVVIPFTSIIDQTARVYREALGRLGRLAVVEHHSNLDPARETYHNRLASENWDAPVVVTTSVQFFESLFARRTSALRKVHNVARSVVVFDEAQTLPHHLRAPIFDALNQLVDHYGVSALFCTATQPALGMSRVGRQGFPHLGGVTEVMPDVTAAFDAVKDRVAVNDLAADAPPVTWDQLAAEVVGHDRVLVIIHRRDDARDLCRLLPADTLHLSALMCAAHRKEVIDRIAARLRSG